MNAFTDFRRDCSGRRPSPSLPRCYPRGGLAMPDAVFRSRILRKQDDLPRYIVVKPEHACGYRKSFPALVSLNDSAPFERNIRPWGKGSDVFFFNLTEPQCRKAALDTGDECVVTIRPKARLF